MFCVICSLEFSEKERQQVGVYDACGCLWMYLADLRASDGRSHVHYNHFYDTSKFQGPLLPPAAALAPTLWPQFHLRWACPSEAQAGEIEAHCRNMAKKISELQKVHDVFAVAHACQSLSWRHFLIISSPLILFLLSLSLYVCICARGAGQMLSFFFSP